MTRESEWRRRLPLLRPLTGSKTIFGVTAVAQPTGTVTMLFTDIEGSTRLLQELGIEAYRAALAAHRDVIRSACASGDGYEVDYEGDSFFFAFRSARAAVAAAAELMVALETSPIRVRVGIHTGEPGLDPPKYVGMDVHRAARIMAAAHGGQTVLSRETAELLPDSTYELLDLGDHRFKDLGEPERLFQLVVPGTRRDFPRLRSLYRTTLPVPATPLLGREAELTEVVERLVQPSTRLLTLTGPGGTGKTRLALQAAAEVSESFLDGVTWVALAPLREPELLFATIAQALDLRPQTDEPLLDTLVPALLGRRILLVLDNAEHLLPSLSDDLAGLMTACPTLTLLVTSRGRLQLSGETTWPVPPLSAPDAERLFVERARQIGVELEPGLVIGELCARLDQMPLAIELAAARTMVFEPVQLLQRLGDSLDLLRGSRDADPRQQTLRATIEWSYALLGPDERRVLRALSVFAAGCTLDAAEHVCGADPDTLQLLIDNSLLRRRDGGRGRRFWLLETIRQFAAEKLAEEGEDDRVKNALLDWLDAFTQNAEEALKGGPEQAAWYREIAVELPNLRIGYDEALARGDARALAHMVRLGLWWDTCAVPEGRDRFERVLAAFPEAPMRARGLAWVGLLAQRAGDLDAAVALTEAALDLARATGDPWAEAWALNTSADDSWVRNDGAAARAGWLEALSVARRADDPWLEQAIEANYVTVTPPEEVRAAGARGIDHLAEAAAARQDDFMLAFIDSNRGDAAAQRGEWEEAARLLAESQRLFTGYGSWWWLTAAAPRIEALVHLGRLDEALELARTTLDYAAENLYLAPVDLSRLLVATAALLTARGRYEAAAAVLATGGALLAGDSFHLTAYRRVRALLEAAAPPGSVRDDADAAEVGASGAIALAIRALGD